MVTTAVAGEPTPAIARHRRPPTAKLVVLATPVIPEVDEREYRAVAELARIAGCAVVVARTPAEQCDAIADADLAFGYLAPAVLAHARRLRWLQAVCSGVDHQLYPAFVASPVLLTSEKGLVGPQLAEQAFALLLALTRGVGTAIRAQQWGARAQIRAAAWELTCRTLGVIGLGGKGSAVARRAAAFGMEVLAMASRPRPAGAPFVRAVWGPERFRTAATGS